MEPNLWQSYGYQSIQNATVLVTSRAEGEENAKCARPILFVMTFRTRNA